MKKLSETKKKQNNKSNNDQKWSQLSNLRRE